MKFKKEIIIAVTAFIAGLAVYDIFFVDLYLATKVEETNTPERVCPTRASFPEVWNMWSDKFSEENPGAGSEGQLREWNSLMVGIGCPEWVDPFKNVVSSQTVTTPSGSTTEVYQYELPE